MTTMAYLSICLSIYSLCVLQEFSYGFPGLGIKIKNSIIGLGSQLDKS